MTIVERMLDACPSWCEQYSTARRRGGAVLLRGLRLPGERGHGLRPAGRSPTRPVRCPRWSAPTAAPAAWCRQRDAARHGRRDRRRARRARQGGAHGPRSARPHPERLPVERRGGRPRRSLRGDAACCSPSISSGLRSAPASAPRRRLRRGPPLLRRARARRAGRGPRPRPARRCAPAVGGLRSARARARLARAR